MIELISCLVAFGIVFGIPYMISRKEQKIQERKNIDEFVRKSFGENYKEKMKRWERGE